MRRAVLTGVVGGVLFLLGCSSGASSGDASRPDAIIAGTETVELSVDHRTRWRELRIEGATDLPDEAVVTYFVTHALTNEAPLGEWPAQNLITDGTAVVNAGQYWAEINTTYWPPGSVQVQVQFPVAPQPPAIQSRYGEFGEHLTGSNVTAVAASKVVTIEHSFDWTR